MNAKRRLTISIIGLAILLSVFTAWSSQTGTTSDPRMIGQWRGNDRFSGLSYQEIKTKKVATQNVAVVLTIAADGQVTGQVGGATLTNCVVKKNRGWLARHLHLKTDFIIIGNLTGAVVPGSDAGTHAINAPFNLRAAEIAGSMFAVRAATYPYPILDLRLTR